MVATPFGPNQAMNAFGRRVDARAGQRDPDRHRAARLSSVTATSATAAQPSPNRPSSVSSAPNTTKMPSLTISTMSSARCSKRRAQVGAADAERDRADEDRDEAVAVRRQADGEAVDRERDAERVERLRVRRDRSVSLRPRGNSIEATTPSAIPNAKPSVTSWSTNFHHTKSLGRSPARR